MKTKSKKTPKENGSTVPSSKDLSGPVIIDGFTHFSPFDLTRYELAQAKVLNAAQGIGLKKAAIEEVRHRYEDTCRKLGEELSQIMAVSKRCENELRHLQEELQNTYKLDFSQITYDDISGRIYVQGKPVPTDGTT